VPSGEDLESKVTSEQNTVLTLLPPRFTFKSFFFPAARTTFFFSSYSNWLFRQRPVPLSQANILSLLLGSDELGLFVKSFCREKSPVYLE